MNGDGTGQGGARGGASPEAVFEALPGVGVPVGGIAQSLARLWEGEAGESGRAPSDFRASQMNLVLHLGLPTTPEDGLAQFQAAVRFTRRHPARIVVLCPRAEGGRDLAMRAKIHSECFIGDSRGEMSCIEAVMLSYPQESRAFLEDQVSVIVEADLPVNYWIHRMSQVRSIAGYRWLLGHARRCVLDTAVCVPEAAGFPWPRPDGFRNLAYSRLLPVRQSLGQYLSGIAPGEIVRGLASVTVRHGPGFGAEAGVLLAWTCDRLKACGMAAGPAFSLAPAAAGEPASLGFDLAYADGRRFSWRANFARGCARFESTLSGPGQVLPVAAGLLPPEAALSDAIFS